MWNGQEKKPYFWSSVNALTTEQEGPTKTWSDSATAPSVETSQARNGGRNAHAAL